MSEIPIEIQKYIHIAKKKNHTYWLTSNVLLLREERINSKDWFRAYVSRPQVSKMLTPREISL